MRWTRRASTAARRDTTAPRRYGKFDEFEKSALSREAKKKQREDEGRNVAMEEKL